MYFRHGRNSLRSSDIHFAYIPVIAPSDGVNTLGSIISPALPSIIKFGVFRSTVPTGGKDSKYYSPSLAQIPSTRQVPVSLLIENEAHFGGLLRDPGVILRPNGLESVVVDNKHRYKQS